MPLIPRPPKLALRDRPLNSDEAQRILQASESTPHLYIDLLLMFGTAGRSVSVLELKWDKVDFVRGTIDLRVDVTGPRKERAVVPMNPFLPSELLKWKEVSDCDYVVSWRGEPIRSLKVAFQNARKRAGLPDIRIHDIRHTAAVWMLAAGSSIQRISQYLGHTTLDQTFKVYARYQPDHLRTESASLDVSDLVTASPMPSEVLTKRSIMVHDNAEFSAITIYKKLQPDLATFVRKNIDEVTEVLLEMAQKKTLSQRH